MAAGLGCCSMPVWPFMCQFFRKLAFAVMVKGSASAGRFALVAVGLTVATADRSVFFGTDRGYGLA
jgi:hypothetical protein